MPTLSEKKGNRSMYEDNSIRITENTIFTKTDGATVKIQDISGVHIVHRSAWAWLAVLGYIALLIGLLGGSYFAMCMAVFAGVNLGYWFFGWIGGGILAIIFSKVLPPKKHIVVINIHGNDQGLIWAYDAEYINKISTMVSRALK